MAQICHSSFSSSFRFRMNIRWVCTFSIFKGRTGSMSRNQAALVPSHPGAPIASHGSNPQPDQQESHAMKPDSSADGSSTCCEDAMFWLWWILAAWGVGFAAYIFAYFLARVRVQWRRISLACNFMERVHGPPM